MAYLFFAWMDTHHDASFVLFAFVSTATFLLSLAVAYAAMTRWDEPVRRWLKKKC